MAAVRGDRGLGVDRGDGDSSGSARGTRPGGRASAGADGSTSARHGARWVYVTATPLTGFGPTTHVVETCRALAAIRPTTLVAPTPPPEPIDGLDVHVVPLPEAAPVEIRYQARLARALPEIARNADVIYVRGAAFNLGVLMTARRLGVPAVLELNGLPGLEYRLLNAGSRARLRGLAYDIFARLDARAASGVVTVTPELADAARDWGAARVYAASNGVDPDRVTPLPIGPARERLGWPVTAFVIGFVGHFAPWQGLETLIDGVIRSRTTQPGSDIRLLLIGDGGEREALAQRADPLGDAIRFTGPLPRNEVPETLAACDVLALPSAPIERNRRTGLSPIKLYEYLALGRPVLVSDLPSLRFIARDGLGISFRAGDADDLAAVLTDLAALDRGECAAMGTRARAAAETRFSWRAVTAGIVDFVESDVLAGRHGFGELR